jgi:UDP-glucose 4-epimerase
VATSILGAAAECRSIEHVVVRSGIEVYGRSSSSLTRPDEATVLHPTSGFGASLADIEDTATTIARRVGITVGALRFAPVLGPHVPAPLGRVLRMPFVPYNPFGDPAFALLHLDDAARALVAAARIGLDEPVNVVGHRSITAARAARRGRRTPVPVVGPQWRVARPLSWVAGAPIPEHVAELVRHGRLADNTRMREVLGFEPNATTIDVVDELFAWPTIIRQPPRVRAA